MECFWNLPKDALAAVAHCFNGFIWALTHIAESFSSMTSSMTAPFIECVQPRLFVPACTIYYFFFDNAISLFLPTLPNHYCFAEIHIGLPLFQFSWQLLNYLLTSLILSIMMSITSPLITLLTTFNQSESSPWIRYLIHFLTFPPFQ